jgi:hypothetical protein
MPKRQQKRARERGEVKETNLQKVVPKIKIRRDGGFFEFLGKKDVFHCLRTSIFIITKIHPKSLSI